MGIDSGKGLEIGVQNKLVNAADVSSNPIGMLEQEMVIKTDSMKVVSMQAAQEPDCDGLEKRSVPQALPPQVVDVTVSKTSIGIDPTRHFVVAFHMAQNPTIARQLVETIEDGLKKERDKKILMAWEKWQEVLESLKSLKLLKLIGINLRQVVDIRF